MLDENFPNEINVNNILLELHVHVSVSLTLLFLVSLSLSHHSIIFTEEALSQPRSAAPSSSEREWLSQVEILTYAPPSRRLWMGPQFSFKAYTTSSVSPSGDHASGSSANALSSATILHTPSPPNTVIYSSSLNSPTSTGGVIDSSSHLPLPSHGAFRTGVQSSLSQNSLDNGNGRFGCFVATRVEEGGGGGTYSSEDVSLQLQSAVLFPSSENALLDLLSDPEPEMQNLTLASIHSEPLSMPTSSSHSMGKEGNSEQASVDPGEEKLISFMIKCFSKPCLLNNFNFCTVFW